LSWQYAVSSTTTVIPVAEVPSVFHDGSCLPVNVGLRSLDWSQTPDLSATGSTMKIYIVKTLSNTITYHSDSECLLGAPAGASASSTTSVSTITFGPSANYSQTVYIKFSGFPTGGQFYQMFIEYFDGVSSTQRAAYFLKTMDTPSPGEPTQIKLTGPTQFVSSVLASHSCVGPFRMATVDSNGVEVTGSSDNTVDISVLTGMLYFELDPTKTPCHTSTNKLSGSTYSFGTTSKKGSQFFYLRPMSLLGNEYTQYLYANSGLNLHRASIPLHFDIDSATKHTEASPYRCSGTVCITAPN
jgi:hypothetical protein